MTLVDRSSPRLLFPHSNWWTHPTFYSSVVTCSIQSLPTHTTRTWSDSGAWTTIRVDVQEQPHTLPGPTTVHSIPTHTVWLLHTTPHTHVPTRWICLWWILHTHTFFYGYILLQHTALYIPRSGYLGSTVTTGSPLLTVVIGHVGYTRDAVLLQFHHTVLVLHTVHSLRSRLHCVCWTVHTHY